MRAAGAIVSVLNDKGNEKLREEVTKVLKATATCDDIISEVVLAGVKGILAHLKSKTHRKVQGKVMMKHIIAACVFHVEKENASVRNSVLSKELGISTHQLTLAREKVANMINYSSLGFVLTRKERADRVRERLMRYVYLYLKDDKYTRVDTNQGSAEGKDPVTGEIISEHMRIWENSNKEEQ